MQILFHRSGSGRSYVEQLLDDLDPRSRATILAVFADIRRFGLQALGCGFRQIEGKLWEIRIATPGGGYRFFYVMLSADEMYVLHGYKKQGQKAPRKELALAQRRLKEVLS